MNFDILEKNKIYKAKILEVYSKDCYKIAILIPKFYSNNYYTYVCIIKNSLDNSTKINTILNQYQLELYAKIIDINKILIVEIKIKELDQFVNLF